MNVAHPGCNIVIIGFSATGKSRVAPAVAAALGWEHFDADSEVCRIAGKSADDIFKQDGEVSFRALEKRVLQAAALKRNTVICTGGGVVVSPDNRELMNRAGMVVLLEAKPETVLRRLQTDVAHGGPVRPLLAVPDPLKRITELKQERQQAYAAAADWTVHTDNLALEEVVLEVIRGWRYWWRIHCGDEGTDAGSGIAAVVATATQGYPIQVGWDILETLGHKMSGIGLSGKAFVVTDETVDGIYGQRIVRFLEEGGFNTKLAALPPGEASKNLKSVSHLYDFLVEHRAERGDIIVAFGGGVVGDTAGFVAATFNRGMRLVQVPTTLVGMVDSSIGGKVGVDHPRGKNLIGAFHQPCLVFADVQLLATLPLRELSAGWAEVVKHGLIADAEYFEFVERHVAELLALEQDAVIRSISRSAAIKAEVVSRDERETLGKRILLNYGHTIGHGIETATGYGKYLHGEAVAIGMVGAAMLSQRMGMIDREAVERHRSVFKEFSLPVTCPGVRRADVMKAMQLDKKVKQGSIRWVLLEGMGKTVVRSDVPGQYVEQVLANLKMD